MKKTENHTLFHIFNDFFTLAGHLSSRVVADIWAAKGRVEKLKFLKIKKKHFFSTCSVELSQKLVFIMFFLNFFNVSTRPFVWDNHSRVSGAANFFPAHPRVFASANTLGWADTWRHRGKGMSNWNRCHRCAQSPRARYPKKLRTKKGKGAARSAARKFYVPRRERAPHEVRSGATYRTVPREAWQQSVRTEKGKGIALRYRIEYRAGSNNIPLKS